MQDVANCYKYLLYISVLLWFSHTSTKSQVVENIIISVSFWPRYSIPREWKKLCYYTKKYKNQAGMNLTPPPPSQNSHAVGWHCTAESEWRVAEIKSWLLCCHPTDQQACDQVSKGRREAGIIIIVHFYIALLHLAVVWVTVLGVIYWYISLAAWICAGIIVSMRACHHFWRVVAEDNRKWIDYKLCFELNACRCKS